MLGTDIRDCPNLSEREVRRVLSAELRMELSTRPAPPTSVVIRCDDTRVTLRVYDGITRKTLERTFNFQTASRKAWSRLIGIAAAELVVVSWTELDAMPAPRVEPEGAAVQATLRQGARSVARSYTDWSPERPPAADVTGPPPAPYRSVDQLRVLALASGLGFLSSDDLLWGGGGRVGYDYRAGFGWTVDGLFMHGTFSEPSGTYGIDTTMIGAAVLASHQWRRWSVRAGGGLRIGMVWTTPEESDGSAGAASVVPWGWPLAVVSISLRPSSRWTLELSTEASYAVLPVSRGSAGLEQPAIGGAWLSVQLGIGWSRF
jgi:hypothetical protein